MRVGNNNNQFFKSSQSNVSSIEKHRFWISLSTPQGAYNEFLLGYVQGATNNFDTLFDGRTIAAENSVAIYTLLGSDNFAIQGRSLPFNNSDIVPIGYSTTINGELTINLENFDGLFDNQTIYLFDKTTGIYHDLKSNVFTFTTASGTFNNRFELRFNASALNNNVNSNFENKVNIVTIQDQLLVSSNNNTITKVEIYDMLGKLLFVENEVSSNEFQTTLNNLSSQLLIVKVTLDNQQIFTKKISFK
jgi:flavodoxin